MAVLTPWRMGNAAVGYIDLPDPQEGTSLDFEEQGGEARSKDGTLLVDRTGPVKRRLTISTDPGAPAALWQPMIGMHLDSVGPFEIYDPLLPNLLSLDDRLGDGWMTSTGAVIPAQPNMRIRCDATYPTQQTAITTAPAIATLVPVTPGVQYTAAITVETAATLSATMSVFGYTGPAGSGTLQGASVAVAAAGRYLLTFTPAAGIVWISLRVARTSGGGFLLDPTVFPGARDPGRSVYLARLSGVSGQPGIIGDRMGFSATLAQI